MSLSYLHYDVFTDTPLEGNQLAVFTDGRALAPTQMQRIAREMNFSESTFILPTRQPDTDLRMRIFTPFEELPMAGHPTIGSTFALAETGVIATGTPRFVFDLPVGPTPVDLVWKDGGLQFVWMTQLPPVFGPAVAQREPVAQALGLREDDLAPLPVQEATCGTPYLLVPLRTREAVDRAIPDAAAARRLKHDHGLARPIFLFAFDAPCTAYSRMFAPDLGIPEDPATGSASGPLGCYLVEHGLVSGEDAQHIVSRQGVAMGRPSRIHIAIDGMPGAITRVRVGGEAVLVGRGELLV